MQLGETINKSNFQAFLHYGPVILFAGLQNRPLNGAEIYKTVLLGACSVP